MKANEIRKMNAEQLNEKLVGLKKDLFMLRMQTQPTSWTIPLR
ncbi:50S ribosomal protein L29 [Dysosmobacter welbionis]